MFLSRFNMNKDGFRCAPSFVWGIDTAAACHRLAALACWRVTCQQSVNNELKGRNSSAWGNFVYVTGLSDIGQTKLLTLLLWLTRPGAGSGSLHPRYH
jgi:hypothetical protein